MNNEPPDPRIKGDQLVIETSNETEIYDLRFLVAALLLRAAKVDGFISGSETDRMLQLIGDHFQIRNAESLEVLRHAMEQMAENPDLVSILKGLAGITTPAEKEDIAVMLLKVIAADGRHDAQEMDSVSEAADILDISPESMHRAFDRYFSSN